MAQRIALTMFYRGLQTHEAIEILLKQKLVEDARVLVRVLVENEVNCAYMLLVGDEETATDFVKHPRYWNYFLMRDLKSVDENRFRRQVSVELEDETRKEYEALRPRFKDRRNGEWCVDAKLHARARNVDEKLAEFVKQPYIEFRWLVNSEWRVVQPNGWVVFDIVTERCFSPKHMQAWFEADTWSWPWSPHLFSRDFAVKFFADCGISLLGSFLVPLFPGVTECLIFRKYSRTTGLG
jgi:Family of unknown function (DUF5677)